MFGCRTREWERVIRLEKKIIDLERLSDIQTKAFTEQIQLLHALAAITGYIYEGKQVRLPTWRKGTKKELAAEITLWRPL